MVYENIKSTLLSKGYSGPVSIWLYANHESQIQKDYKEDYESAGFRFCFEPEGGLNPISLSLFFFSTYCFFVLRVFSTYCV